LKTHALDNTRRSIQDHYSTINSWSSKDEKARNPILIDDRNSSIDKNRNSSHDRDTYEQYIKFKTVYDNYFPTN